MFSTMQDEQLSLATLLRYAATVHAAATVSTWTGGELRVMTFAELGREAARLAHALHGLGVQAGDRVATFMWNNNEHMVAYAAIPAMGAVLHALNIRLFADQLIHVANHAEDRVVLVDASLLPMFAQYLPALQSVQDVIVVGGDAASVDAPAGVRVHSYQDLLAAGSDSYDYPVLDERTAAGMCYTSGTTGDPKGVVYSHRSNWLQAMQVVSGMNICDHDVALVIVPLFHANAWALPYAALMCGASLLMPDRFLQPARLLQMMAAAEPTFAAAVPTIWGGVLTALEQQPQDISYLRSVVVGGAAVPPAMMRVFEQRHGVRLVHAWGMSETSPLGCISQPPKGVSGEEEWEYRYKQGRFPAAVQARIVGEDGSVLPSDGKTWGELEVRGPWVTGSYYCPGDEQVGADRFHDGWLRTGDVGTITPNGYLTLVDRAKDLIKSGGEWISSVDLENAVMADPAVAEAAVIGVPDPKWSERPLVVVVLEPGHTAQPQQLRQRLSGSFAAWQLPEHWAFVAEIPKTSVGKFDKKQLRAAHAAGELAVQTLR